MNNLEFMKIISNKKKTNSNKNDENEKFLEIMKICYSIIFYYCLGNRDNQKYN